MSHQRVAKSVKTAEGAVAVARTTERRPDRRYVKGSGCTVDPYTLTTAGLTVVKQVTSEGAGPTGIARLLKISRKAVTQLIDRDPDVQAAVNDGLAALDEELTQGIKRIATEGKSWPGLLALGKVKLGWMEGQAPEHVPRAQPSVNVNIVLPQPVAPGDLAKIVNVDPSALPRDAEDAEEA